MQDDKFIYKELPPAEIKQESEPLKNSIAAWKPELPANTAVETLLNQESQDILNKVVVEHDVQKSKDLTALFNLNQNKKTMVRINKLNTLLDALTDQTLTRVTNRPDEISNAELLTGLKTVQDLVDKSTKQINGANEGAGPLIQINNQTNELNVSTEAKELSKESRDKVRSAVLAILGSAAKPEQLNYGEDLSDDGE